MIKYPALAATDSFSCLRYRFQIRLTASALLEREMRFMREKEAGFVFTAYEFGDSLFLITSALLSGEQSSTRISSQSCQVCAWPSLVCIIMMVSGVQLFCLGIVGQYLSKTYMEVKNRPIYLVKEDF